jgi:transmembrane sensor
VRYTGHDRRVDLARGTIFADVAHDPDRPFRIHTGDAQILDVGTSFEVLSRPGMVRVAVATGNVRFGREGWFDKPLELVAQQAARLDGEGLVRTADVDPGAVARWRVEWAEYKGAPLSEVVADLQSLSPLPIEIADRSLARRPVSGRIRLTDPIEQLQNLAIIHAFRLRRVGDRIVLTTN